MHQFFQPLQIKSVMAKEGLKGYIYVEAFKQTHVKQAIDGVGNLRIGKWAQQVRLQSFSFSAQCCAHDIPHVMSVADGADQGND